MLHIIINNLSSSIASKMLIKTCDTQSLHIILELFTVFSL